ncbi:MAG: DUF3426 domain-containing protein [Acidovorax sp.]|nr:DUF3426 domain-containing protein [Acidovorax sp.]
MSQITCCPSCGTKFKVVADQLRISEGWVRCGQCKEIFDATAHLQAASELSLLPDFPMDGWPLPQAPAPANTAFAPALPASPAVLDVPVPEVPTFLAMAPAADAAPSSPTAGPAFRWTGGEVPVPGAVPADAEGVQDVASLPEEPSGTVPSAAEDVVPMELQGYELPFAELRDEGPDELLGDGEADGGTADAAGIPGLQPDVPSLLKTDAGEVAAPAVPDAEPSDEEPPLAQPEPGFVRAARRKAFWHSAGMRALLVLLALGLVVGLAGQMALQERNHLAAWEPRLRPWLSSACELLGCAVGPRRDIAVVVIDSSGFNKAARGDAYQLSLVLKNRAGTPVAMPAIELTLTDAQEQPVLRRVLLPKDLNAPAELAAQAEWSGALSVALAASGPQVAGYRVLAFYP